MATTGHKTAKIYQNFPQTEEIGNIEMNKKKYFSSEVIHSSSDKLILNFLRTSYFTLAYITYSKMFFLVRARVIFYFRAAETARKTSKDFKEKE